MIFNKKYKIYGFSDEEFSLLEKTSVFKSEDSPTGYLVSFRIKMPEKTWVGVIGDWMFSDKYHSSRYTSGKYWPHQWKSDYFPHTLLGLKEKPKALEGGLDDKKIDPSQFKFDWDVLKLGLYEMEKDEKSGIFSCTIPLPSGTFNYRFVLEIPDGNPLLMETIPDQNNLSPYFDSKQKYSQVIVPFDCDKQTYDRSVELPDSSDNKGVVDFDTYKTNTEYKAGEDQPANIYLPFGYDEKREKKYPVLFLSHGGRGTQSDWFTCGSIKNILDGLIEQGKAEPMVVVTMDNEAFEWRNKERCIPNLMNYLIPFIESKYHVATETQGRAFAGISAGGFLAFDLFAAYPDKFRYFGIWSGGKRGEVELGKDAFLYPEVHIAGGRYDDASYDFGFALEDKLQQNGISFTSYFPDGAHQWSVWREIFKDFVSRVLWR